MTDVNPTDSESRAQPLQDVNLEMVLRAWDDATSRLQSTHETLRAEVRRLTDELEAKNHELQRKKRLADLGEMASHVAHELRNGLVPLRLYLSLLGRRLGDRPDVADCFEKLAAGFGALEGTVNDLLQFGSSRSPHREWFSLEDVVQSIGADLAPQFRSQGIEWLLASTRGERTTSPRADATEQMAWASKHPNHIFADRDMIRRAVLNLVLNAIDALPHGGRIEAAVVVNASHFEVTIHDTGAGIPEESIAAVFEPFFSTKRNGAGLGLAIVRRTMELHDGEALASNHVDGGAVFTIRGAQTNGNSSNLEKNAA